MRSVRMEWGEMKEDARTELLILSYLKYYNNNNKWIHGFSKQRCGAVSICNLVKLIRYCIL